MKLFELKTLKKSLFVSRRLLNAGDFIAWAKSQGFKTTMPAKQIHVTICYSKEPMDWHKAGDHFDKLEFTDKHNKRSVIQLGDEGAVVLKFPAKELQQRWQAFRDAGASWEYKGYKPHVTITYKMPKDMDLSKVEPYKGVLKFGPEIYKEIDSNWDKGLKEK